eukprot:CAMPEP_0172499920 /NCGR_PEP_ID=MMETSP1066-20121228/132399_1 /TAXON_ID=671091 /ORGANISM="Coscinodiscus wailesii, Strain CCMP2513" /LENGTH=302 /DNA_ID=CAMNT_0013273913 /DNA_START=21 /DNA_END=930 /DNA_ORIENTATION=+
MTSEQEPVFESSDLTLDSKIFNSCTLLGGTYATIVQIFLALSGIATLVYKRQTELIPRRPWLVWFFDTSKQAYASLLQHIVNLAFGVSFASGSDASECAWYLVNFTVTLTCGIVILHFAMMGYARCVDAFSPNLDILKSGEYGEPPSWKPWVVQMLLWGLLASGEKFITFFLILLPFHSVLDGVAVAIEKPLLGYPRLELVIVMIIAPAILNAVFYWLIDTIIMNRNRDELHPMREENDLGQPILPKTDYCSMCGLSNYIRRDEGEKAASVPFSSCLLFLTEHHKQAVEPSSVESEEYEVCQ